MSIFLKGCKFVHTEMSIILNRSMMKVQSRKRLRTMDTFSIPLSKFTTINYLGHITSWSE